MHYKGSKDKTEIYKSKAHNNICWYEFYFGSASKDFTKKEQAKISLNRTVYDFRVNHSLVEK